MRTYSFKDTSGALTDPDAGAFLFAGQIGLHQFHIAMNTEKTVHDKAADGSIMVTYISGDNGQVAIEMQQTCSLNAFLLNMYNLKKVAADAGAVDSWASTAITLRNAVDGSVHVMTGVSPSKVPDKIYAEQGQRLVWTLMCADIQSVIVGV